MEEVTTLLAPAGVLVVGGAAGTAVVEELEGPVVGDCITGGYMEIVGRTG